MSTWDNYEALVKVLVIGDSAVGKSSLLLRYSEGEFHEDHLSTIGVDLKMKTVESHGKTVKLQIWDTAGQERFQTITSSYYRGCHGIVLTFDITNQESFDHVQKWLDDVKRYAPTDISLVLVGNKADMADKRVVSAETAKQLAEQLKVPHYIETSAKMGTNVEETFAALVDLVMEKQLKKAAERQQYEQEQQQGQQRANLNKAGASNNNNGTKKSGGLCMIL